MRSVSSILSGKLVFLLVLLAVANLATQKTQDDPLDKWCQVFCGYKPGQRVKVTFLPRSVHLGPGSSFPAEAFCLRQGSNVRANWSLTQAPRGDLFDSPGIPPGPDYRTQFSVGARGDMPASLFTGSLTHSQSIKSSLGVRATPEDRDLLAATNSLPIILTAPEIRDVGISIPDLKTREKGLGLAFGGDSAESWSIQVSMPYRDSFEVTLSDWSAPQEHGLRYATLVMRIKEVPRPDLVHEAGAVGNRILYAYEQDVKITAVRQSDGFEVSFSTRFSFPAEGPPAS